MEQKALVCLMGILIFMLGVSVGAHLLFHPANPQPDYLTAYLRENYGVNSIDELIAKYRQEALSKVQTQTLEYFSQPFDYHLPTTSSLEIQPFTEPSYLPAPTSTVTFSLEPFAYLAVNSLSSFAFVFTLFLGQVNRRLKLKLPHKLLGLFVLVFLWGVFIGTYVIAPALASSTVTLEPGSFVETASYVIWGEDTDNDGVADMIYAKNGQTGEIEFSGTDAATVVQQTINALGEGGKIYVAEGLYIITKKIQIDRRITLEGAGSGASKSFNKGMTIFYLADNFPDDMMIELVPSTGLEDTHWQLPQFKHLMLYGNKANQAHKVDAIVQQVGSAIDIRFEDIWFDSWKGNCIVLRDYYDHRIINCVFEHNDYECIVMSGDVNVITDVLIFGAYALHQTLFRNLSNKYASRWTIIGCTANADGADIALLDLTRTSWFKIIGNAFYKSSIGIELDSTTYYPIIALNSFDVVSTPISGSGSSTYPPIIKYNSNYVTENSGTATFSGTSVSFAHGLAGTPTGVWASFNSTGYGGWTWTANSTHITITVANTGDYTVYWWAEYKP